MNRSVKYLLIIGLFFCAKQNFAKNKASFSSFNGFYAESTRGATTYQDHPYTYQANAVLSASVSPIQISRSQHTRSVHFARELFVSIYKFGSEIHAAANKSYCSNVDFSAMRKRILFPFHADW